MELLPKRRKNKITGVIEGNSSAHVSGIPPQ